MKVSVKNRTEKMFEVTFVADRYVMTVHVAIPFAGDEQDAILDARDIIIEEYGFNPESHCFDVTAQLLGYN